MGELRVWPVEVADEGLEGVQLPEQVLRGRTAVAGKRRKKIGRRWTSVKRPKKFL